MFLTPEGSFPYSLAWVSSEPIQWERTGEGHTDTLFEGAAMLFDVYAFPQQATTDPDPVLAMNHYVRTRFEDAVVIGDSAIPGVLEPTAEHPVFYFREETSETYRETNTVVWLNAVLACHVFAAGQEGAWIQTLCNYLRLEGEVTMLDHSPMFMRDVRTNNTAAALSAGQVRLHVRYGLLRMYEPVPALFHANRTMIPNLKRRLTDMSKEAKPSAEAVSEETAESPQNVESAPQTAEPESVYSVEELTKAAAGLFGTTPDIVRTALRMEGVTQATVSDAKRIVRKFRKREVQ